MCLDLRTQAFFRLVSEGNLEGVRAMVVAEALRQLGVLSADDLDQLTHWRDRDVKNRRGDVVGHIGPTFQLEMNPHS